MLKKQILTLEIVYEDLVNPDNGTTYDIDPACWEWRTLLDLNPNENVKVVEVLHTEVLR